MMVAAATTKANQNIVLQLYRDNPALTRPEIERLTGIKAGTIHDWYYRNTYGYRDKLAQTIQEAFDDMEGLAVVKLKENIEAGNFNAIKYVLDNKGYNAPQKLEVNGPVEIDLSIHED